MPKNLSSFRLDHLQSGNSTSEEHSNGSQPRHAARHSLGEGFVFPNERNNDATTPVPSNRPVPLQSYSTNDLPTVKGNSNGFDAAITPPKSHAESSSHQHHSSIGRIPPGNSNPRSVKGSPESESIKATQPGQTFLQANAPSFGPQIAPAATNAGLPGYGAPNPLQFSVHGAYPSQSFLNQAGQVNNQISGLPAATPYAAYPNYVAGYRFNDPNARGGVGQRRQTESDSSQRFAHYPLEHYKGEIYSLCKDQHGCRYLQRKLEERNPDHVQLIFSETYMHVIELMTGKDNKYSQEISGNKLTHRQIPSVTTSARSFWNSRMMNSVPRSSTMLLPSWSRLRLTSMEPVHCKR